VIPFAPSHVPVVGAGAGGGELGDAQKMARTEMQLGTKQEDVKTEAPAEKSIWDVPDTPGK
jgi:hypothetical protein